MCGENQKKRNRTEKTWVFPLLRNNSGASKELRKEILFNNGNPCCLVLLMSNKPSMMLWILGKTHREIIGTNFESTSYLNSRTFPDLNEKVFSTEID